MAQILCPNKLCMNTNTILFLSLSSPMISIQNKIPLGNVRNPEI